MGKENVKRICIYFIATLFVFGIVFVIDGLNIGTLLFSNLVYNLNWDLLGICATIITVVIGFFISFALIEKSNIEKDKQIRAIISIRYNNIKNNLGEPFKILKTECRWPSDLSLDYYREQLDENYIELKEVALSGYLANEDYVFCNYLYDLSSISLSEVENQYQIPRIADDLSILEKEIRKKYSLNKSNKYSEFLEKIGFYQDNK
ncbi:hypothetical protein FEZ08_11535 [Culicoidibacter larvae]|uniref:Uncharacterized protein n=2 Tax=Culicoidibacter larvae TaxID=2579976 RepID=A0A5R8Q6Z1_9FIRM|nr:hypothetical protein FEZ08_11535 [Culicoidibacter larvae]